MYERCQNRFQTLGDEFDFVPGQVLFHMALEVCNANAEMDYSAAEKALTNLTLAMFPGA